MKELRVQVLRLSRWKLAVLAAVAMAAVGGAAFWGYTAANQAGVEADVAGEVVHVGEVRLDGEGAAQAAERARGVAAGLSVGASELLDERVGALFLGGAGGAASGGEAGGCEGQREREPGGARVGAHGGLSVQGRQEAEDERRQRFRGSDVFSWSIPLFCGSARQSKIEHEDEHEDEHD